MRPARRDGTERLAIADLKLRLPLSRRMTSLQVKLTSSDTRGPPK